MHTISKGNLLYLQPYFDTILHTPAKNRWFKKSIVDAFSQEYKISKQDAQLLYEWKHLSLIKKNSQSKTPHIVENHDILHLATVYTEKPVLQHALHSCQSIFEDENISVWFKSASIPCHTSNQYLRFTMEYLLPQQMQFCHRIDRCVSGLLILAKSIEMKRKIQKLFEERRVFKLYVAQVRGNVLETDFSNCKAIAKKEDGILHIKRVIKEIEPRRGLFECVDQEEATEKSMVTAFTKIYPLEYNSNQNTSLVFCYPVTGRNKQIRLHLQSIGHPIVNDEKSHSQILNETIDLDHNIWHRRVQVMKQFEPKLDEELQMKIEMEQQLSDALLNEQLALHDSYYSKQQYEIHLHSFLYASEEWKFTTPIHLIPEWCQQTVKQISQEQLQTIRERLE